MTRRSETDRHYGIGKPSFTERLEDFFFPSTIWGGSDETDSKLTKLRGFVFGWTLVAPMWILYGLGQLIAAPFRWTWRKLTRG